MAEDVGREDVPVLLHSRSDLRERNSRLEGTEGLVFSKPKSNFLSELIRQNLAVEGTVSSKDFSRYCSKSWSKDGNVCARDSNREG